MLTGIKLVWLVLDSFLMHSNNIRMFWMFKKVLDHWEIHSSIQELKFFRYEWSNNVFIYFDNFSRNITILPSFFDIQIINDFTNFVRIVFSQIDVVLRELFFIRSVLGCLWYELTVTRIGSAFCKLEWECAVAIIFKLDTTFAKKSLKVEQSSLSFDMTFCFSIKIFCLPFNFFCVKRGKMFFQNALLSVIFLV